MRSPVRINTGRPSAAKAAKTLGVSKKIAKDLALLAQRSLETGEFVLRGVGRLVRVHGKWRVERNPASRAASKSSGKKTLKFRVSKAQRDIAKAPEKKKK